MRRRNRLSFGVEHSIAKFQPPLQICNISELDVGNGSGMTGIGWRGRSEIESSMALSLVA